MQDAEREMAIVEQTRTMHGITCPEQQQDVKLPTTKANFEGVNVQALLDTGSPVKIVSAVSLSSLNYLIRLLKGGRIVLERDFNILV